MSSFSITFLSNVSSFLKATSNYKRSVYSTYFNLAPKSIENYVKKSLGVKGHQSRSQHILKRQPICTINTHFHTLTENWQQQKLTERRALSSHFAFVLKFSIRTFSMTLITWKLVCNNTLVPFKVAWASFNTHLVISSFIFSKMLCPIRELSVCFCTKHKGKKILWRSSQRIPQLLIFQRMMRL